MCSFMKIAQDFKTNPSGVQRAVFLIREGQRAGEGFTDKCNWNHRLSNPDAQPAHVGAASFPRILLRAANIQGNFGMPIRQGY